MGVVQSSCGSCGNDNVWFPPDNYVGPPIVWECGNCQTRNELQWGELPPNWEPPVPDGTVSVLDGEVGSGLSAGG